MIYLAEMVREPNHDLLKYLGKYLKNEKFS